VSEKWRAAVATGEQRTRKLNPG